MNNRKVLSALMMVFTILFAAALAGAQAKPNVSGNWVLNVAKSKFERGGPKNIVIKFDQKDNTLNEVLTISSDQGDRSINFTYSMDGKESTQQLEGNEIKTTAKWEGNTLILEFKNDQGFNFLRKIVLAADGKSLTINVIQTNPNGSVNDIVVLDKQ
jgi:hypothetical protein